MDRGISLGHIAGIEIRLDWSLLIIFLLISLMLATAVFPTWHPDWSPAVAWSTALAAAVLFLASVLLHELSHALVGRRHGMQIRRITLFVFGGMAHLESEPHTWKAEFWMAIVGPLTSLALGIFFLWLAGLLGAAQIDPAAPQQSLARLGPGATLLLWLGPINIILAIFNMVPGFPLDGGRVIRALLWGATHNLRKATRWASQLGQLFAWLLIGSGFAMIMGVRVPIFGTGLVGGLWLMLIGWFLNNAALMSYRQLVVKESLEEVPVRRLMQTDIHKVEPDLTLERLVYDHLLHSDQRAFPVVSGQRLVGLVCLEDVRRTSAEQWAQRRVQDVMSPADRLTTVDPNLEASEALELLSQRAVNQLPVLDKGRLVGMVRREDLLRWLILRSGTGEAATLGG